MHVLMHLYTHAYISSCIHMLIRTYTHTYMCFHIQHIHIEGKKQKTINRGPSRPVDQNNDLCEKCGEGGELLCCDTCNAAWHLKCANLKILPAEDVTWSCPKCVMSLSKQVNLSN